MGRRGGFTLLEVVIAIAVISILASMAVPYAARLIDRSREESTRTEMEGLYAAIMGDPGIPTAGFVGDMGRLPANLAQLNVQGGQPAGVTGFLGVKRGWSGPYVNPGFDAQGYVNDAWGTAYDYGFPLAGQIRSRGPDRQGGAAPNYGDDIIFPRTAQPVNINGFLLVNLYVWDNAAGQFRLNPQPGAMTQLNTTVYWSNNGAQATYAYNLPAAPPFLFGAAPNTLHAGFHPVTATCTLAGAAAAVSGQAVVYVPGNNRQTQVNLYLR